MSQMLRCCARLVVASGLAIPSHSAYAGGLLDQWTWAEVPKPDVPESRIEFSIGSYFGDSDPSVAPDLRQEYGGSQSYWQNVVHEKASDLLARPGGTFAYVSLPTDGIRNVKAVQLGFFDIRGLGAGFDDSGSKTIEIAHEKVLPAVIGECGRVLQPARTIVQTETQSFAEATDDAEKMSGVEFNFVLDDKATFGGVSGFQTFVGPRFISYGDSYLSSLSSSSSFGSQSSSAAQLAVSNRLVGGHVGISGKKFLSPNLLLTGRVTAGLFANFVSQGGSSTSFASGAPDYSFADATRDTGFAQMIEFSPALHVKLKENMFLSFGGTLMLLNGVSEANSSAAAGFAASGGRYDDTGTYLFYGGRATFNWTFN